MSQMSVPDVDMRGSAKRPILEVESDTAPSWMLALAAMINTNLVTTLNGFERKIEQVLGIPQVRLDKHDAELGSQRQLLEDLKSEIGLLRQSGVDLGKQPSDISSDSSSVVGSFNGAQRQCLCVAGILLAQQLRRKLTVLSTRKWRMNCSLGCRRVCKTTRWSVRRSRQTTRSHLASKMVADGSRAVLIKWL